jgi:hypothetical protein
LILQLYALGLQRQIGHDLNKVGFFSSSEIQLTAETLGLLRHIFDNKTMEYFEKFTADYVRDVMKGDDEAKGLRDGFGRESRSVDEDAYLNRPIY